MSLVHNGDEEFGRFQDESADSVDEDVNPTFDETAEGEKRPIKTIFSLGYMKKVAEFYDSRELNGRRRHTWKSTQHRFQSVPHRQCIARCRHYINQHGT